MVRREDYIHKQPDLTRDRWLDVYAEARQSNAELEARRRGERAPVERKQALYVNKVGLAGEWACMVYLSVVHWNYFKKGDIRGIPDLCLGRSWPPGFPPFMDAKTNETKYFTNYLLVPRTDPWDWIYIHCYLEDQIPTNWVLVRPTVTIVGWCWGFEAQSIKPGVNPRLGSGHQIPHNHDMLRPIAKLRVFLDLCRAHGEDRALDLWRQRGEKYEPGDFPVCVG